MRPIPETLKQFQIQGDYMAIINDRGQQQWNLHSSQLPCSCPNCRQYQPGNGSNTCFYAQTRDIKTHIVCQIEQGNKNQPVVDQYGLHRLTIIELKNELKLRGLPVSGNKSNLIQRLENDIEDGRDETVIEDSNEI